MNLHTMTLDELRATKKALAAVKTKRGEIKRASMIAACDAWIKRRVKEKRSRK